MAYAAYPSSAAGMKVNAGKIKYSDRYIFAYMF